MTQDNYWHCYYDRDTVERSNALRQEFYVRPADVELHLDAYLQAAPEAPTLLLTHGEGGYARMLVQPALALHARGYSVLVLDLRGHGLSSGAPGDFTLAQLAQDVLDAAHWARRNFSGPLFLGGANLGGWLAYQAAALGAPVVGLALHQLYDFSSPREVLARSRLSGLAGLPGGAQVASAAARALMAVSPRMRLSTGALARLDGLLDERDNGIYEAWQADPNPPRAVSLRYAVSTLATPPALPYAENALPVLVINPTRDTMIDPAITRRSYEQLGGPKSYVEIDYGHWSLRDSFAQEWAGLIDDWLQELSA
jgi:alpha-beta hydrolase superfamily lysophospholipase